MKQISRKLCSKSGASMILAMVFMLFCMFVGGTVLAAASANGYRVAHLSDQQQYLDERSAALLTAEELRLSSELIANHMLTVNDVEYVVQKIIVGNGGVVTPDPSSSAITVRAITFIAPEGIVMTPFQRIMYETSVLRYIQENSIDTNTVRIILENFVYNYNGTKTLFEIGEFWCSNVSGSLTVNGILNSDRSTFTNFPANFECLGGSSLYDFAVDFGDYSQMSVLLDASLGEREPIVQTTIDEWVQTVTVTGEDGTSKNETISYPAQIKSTTRMPIIMWDTATIVKGGS